MCGPYTAAAWAKARDLEVHYVDNCWLYVTVNRNDLEAFMGEILEGQASLSPRVLSDARYLLMAEEY
jgi:hypothetical protein